MDDPTSLLFGLDGFVVLDVDSADGGPGTVRVVVETKDREAACPECGVMSSRVKDRPLCRVKDLPASGVRAVLVAVRRRKGASGPRRFFRRFWITRRGRPRGTVTGGSRCVGESTRRPVALHHPE